MKNDWKVTKWGKCSFTLLKRFEIYIYGVFEPGYEMYERKGIKHNQNHLITHESIFKEFPECKEMYVKICLKRI